MRTLQNYTHTRMASSRCTPPPSLRCPPASRPARHPPGSLPPVRAPRAAGMQLHPRPGWQPPLHQLELGWLAPGPGRHKVQPGVCTTNRQFETAADMCSGACGRRRAPKSQRSSGHSPGKGVAAWEGVGQVSATVVQGQCLPARLQEPVVAQRSTHQVCGCVVNGGVVHT